MKIITTIATAAVLAAGFAATAASAQVVKTVIQVSYADLNLDTLAGKAVLARRINAAANSACGIDANERDLMSKGTSARCHFAAMASARTAVAAATAPEYASR